MPGMSNYLENKLTDHVLRGIPYTAPTNMYIGIFSTTPSYNSNGTEIAYTGYARLGAALNASNWKGTAGETSGPSSNVSGVPGASVSNFTGSFGTGTIAGLSGAATINGIGIFDASTSGSLLWFGPLAQSKTINNGDPVPTVSLGDLQITLGN